MPDPRITRRSLLAGIGGAGMVRSVKAQTPEASPAALTRIPRLRVGLSSPPDIHAPSMASTMDTMWLSSLVYDAPMRWNAEGDVIPGLFGTTASSRSSVIQLQSRANSVFSDSTSVTSHHALEALLRLRDSPHAWRLQHVDDLTEVSDSTLQITMNRSDASLAAHLCHPLVGIDNEGAGTGPFVLVAADSQEAVYRRNSLFWQIGRPHIDELHILHIADDVQRSLAIATGELDVLPNVPLLDVPMLENEPTVYLVGGPSNRLCHLQLRLSEPVLANRRVRQILSGAIDRSGLVSVATANQAEATSTLIAGDIWTEDVEDVASIPIDDVRSELQALGIPSDLRLHLLADNADATLANTAVVLQEQLANCGISLSITLLEGEALVEAIETGDYDLLVSYSEPWRDPHELVWPLLFSQGPLNWSGYDSAEMDVILQSAIALSDIDFRRSSYSRLETIIQRDVPCIPLFRPYVWDAVSMDFPGYATLPPATSRGLMTLLPTDTA